MKPDAWRNQDYTQSHNSPAFAALMSEQPARWHQGQLLFEGNRRGAVFTVILPPFGG
jgi:hypothetical protein